MVDGKLVSAKYSKSSRNAVRLTCGKFREHLIAGWNDNLAPVLRQAYKVMVFLHDISKKTWSKSSEIRRYKIPPRGLS